jgi:hypothetical protein
MASTSFSDWNFKNYHVQQEMKGGQFVNAETTLVASGPPEIGTSATTGAATGTPSSISVYPIGLLESFALSQSKQLQRIFEIGSSRSYFVPGRVIGSISLGRVFYFGPSLMRVMYAHYQTPADSPVSIGTADSTAQLSVTQPFTGGSISETIMDPQAKLLNVDGISAPVVQSPGDDFFYINLASDLFNQPSGMAVFFKDTSFVTVGAFYLEDIYIQGHQMSISSGSVLIMEGVSAQYDRLVPIKSITGTAV